jgi:chorismate synthase
MNTYGNILRVSIFGESHGECVGVCIDGCAAGIALTDSDFAADLARRRSGGQGTTTRHEDDIPKIVSGIFEGKSTGAPIVIVFNNDSAHSADYAAFRRHPRPSHADYAASVKFHGYNDPRGGGHFSGRMTLAAAAAGVVAKKIIPAIKITAELLEVGGMPYGRHEQALIDAMAQGDSLGGIVECHAANVPAGWGSPFFDSVESLLSHAVFAIPGVRGIEFGTGFGAARMSGSQHNDPIINEHGNTSSNHAGGITGGITNGGGIVFRVAFKPTASIAMPQNTYNFEHKKVMPLLIKGRHDACFALRTPVIVEAMCAIVLADLSLRNN